MSAYVHKSKYFYGNEVSDYGLKNGYVDYRALAKSFDAVLVNDITKLFYAKFDGEYNEVIVVNGDETLYYSKSQDDFIDYDDIDDWDDIQEQTQEVYQYYIISDNGANILKDLTNELVYYMPVLDVYVWGVTHFGTAWDYVLTDIKIELDGDVK